MANEPEEDLSCFECCICQSSGELFEDDINHMYRDEKDDDACSGSES